MKIHWTKAPCFDLLSPVNLDERRFTERTDPLVSLDNTDTANASADFGEQFDTDISMPNLESKHTMDESHCSSESEAIRCVKCDISLSAAIHELDIKMRHCDRCNVYACEQCQYGHSKNYMKCKKRMRTLDT